MNADIWTGILIGIISTLFALSEIYFWRSENTDLSLWFSGLWFLCGLIGGYILLNEGFKNTNFAFQCALFIVHLILSAATGFVVWLIIFLLNVGPFIIANKLVELRTLHAIRLYVSKKMNIPKNRIVLCYLLDDLFSSDNQVSHRWRLWISDKSIKPQWEKIRVIKDTLEIFQDGQWVQNEKPTEIKGWENIVEHVLQTNFDKDVLPLLLRSHKNEEHLFFGNPPLREKLTIEYRFWKPIIKAL